MFLFWIIVFLISTIVIYLLSFNKNHMKEMRMWEEFFTGIKNKKYPKAYHCIFMFVRFLSVLIIIILKNLQYELKVTLFLLLFFSSMLYVVLIRPLVFVKENISESINQISFFMLAFPLLYLESERNWKKVYEYIYLYSLLAVPSINLWINFAGLIKKMCW